MAFYANSKLSLDCCAFLLSWQTVTIMSVRHSSPYCRDDWRRRVSLHSRYGGTGIFPWILRFERIWKMRPRVVRFLFMNLASVSTLNYFSGDWTLIFEAGDPNPIEARSELIGVTSTSIDSNSLGDLHLILFHIYLPFLLTYFFIGDGVFKSVPLIFMLSFCTGKGTLPMYLPSDPARSTIFSRLSWGLPSLFFDKILIWKTWWDLLDLSLTPLFLKIRLLWETSIWSRNSLAFLILIQVCPTHETLFPEDLRST